MSVTGIVKNGVVVLPPGTSFPEGAEVKVETLPIPNESARIPLLSETAARLAKERPHLPPDYALNHGHYLRGESKK